MKTVSLRIGFVRLGAFLFLLFVLQFARAAHPELATLDEVLAAKQDLWGIAAMQQPNGPDYEFFKNLLPPLRYVNAEFRHYPIVLSAPGSANKARLTSNGSGINARANLRTWKETGIPIYFYAGENQDAFGADLKRITG